MKLPFLLLLWAQAPAAGDTVALAAALGHARGFVEEGEIQVSPDVGPDFWGVEERSALLEDAGFIAAAAEAADLAFGPDEAAMECPPAGGCLGVGAFRGLVHVWDFRRLSENAAVIRLRILAFTSTRDWIYERVDDVFVRREEVDDPWIIVRTEELSVS